MKAVYEAELHAAAEKLHQPRSDGDRTKMAARDGSTETVDRDPSAGSGEATAQAKVNVKSLLKKSIVQCRNRSANRVKRRLATE